MRTTQQKGFTLTELLVGLVISMMVSLAVYGTAITYDASRRQVTAGSAAIENGLAGLSGIEYDTRMAGLGFTQNGGLLCPTVNVWYKGKTIANGAPVIPVVITEGGAGKPDQITFMYSDASFGVAPVRLIDPMPTPSSIFKTNTQIGLTVGQQAMVIPTSGTDPCTLVGVTHLANTGFGSTVQHNPGQSDWNPPNPTTVFANAPAYPTGAMIMGVGAFAHHTWRVANGNLEMYDHNIDQAIPVAEHVVALEARYGISSAVGATDIDDWVDATGAWAVLDGTSMRRVRALHVGVLSKSKAKDKQVNGECTTTTVAPALWPNGPVPDLSADADWKCYRYKAVHLAIPLKNIIYGGIN